MDSRQLNLRSGTRLAAVSTLAGAGQIIDSRVTPLLSLAADNHAAPSLLTRQATAQLRALSLGTTTFTYDPNGNLITEVTDEEVLAYAWNADDRLVGITRDAEPVASYVYDASGRRVAATGDADTTNYLWDEQNLLAELDDALETLANYTDYPGVWGGLSSVHAGGASAFFAPDMSSNIRLLLNAAGGVQQASLYSAFGSPLAGATASPMGFGGGLGYFDDGLDRLYVRARHYRPGLGAWMSRDPRSGLHGTYGYASNTPVRLVDPSGLSSWDYWKAYGRALLEGDTWSQGLSTGMAGLSHATYDTVFFGYGEQVLGWLGMGDAYRRYKCEPGYRGAYNLGAGGLALWSAAGGIGAAKGMLPSFSEGWAASLKVGVQPAQNTVGQASKIGEEFIGHIGTPKMDSAIARYNKSWLRSRVGLPELADNAVLKQALLDGERTRFAEVRETRSAFFVRGERGYADSDFLLQAPVGAPRTQRHELAHFAGKLGGLDKFDLTWTNWYSRNDLRHIGQEVAHELLVQSTTTPAAIIKHLSKWGIQARIPLYGLYRLGAMDWAADVVAHLLYGVPTCGRGEE